MKNIIHGLGSVLDIYPGADPELWSKFETDDSLIKAWESVGGELANAIQCQQYIVPLDLPVIKSKSKRALGKNIAAELASGKLR